MCEYEEINPYNTFLPSFSCSTLKELYSKLEIIAREKRGLKQLPFHLYDIEIPQRFCSNNFDFITECKKLLNKDNSSDHAKKLIIDLKNKSPKESYKNPKLEKRKYSMDENNLMVHIFNYGIDLPGSKYNLTGNMQYFSEFFIDMFFGNYTEFMEHVESKTIKKLKTVLNQREGYCQYSPIFPPILGLKMMDIENKLYFTSKEKLEIRQLYNRNNENRHADILAKLFSLGADPNAHDIFGYTALHYATIAQHNREDIMNLLLASKADPNLENRCGERPLAILRKARLKKDLRCVEILIDNGAKLVDKVHIQELRSAVEDNGCSELIFKVREALPRGEQECERCGRFAEDKCVVCGSIYYCSSECTELDWKFHSPLEKKIGLTWKQYLYMFFFFIVMIYIAWHFLWLCYGIVYEYMNYIVVALVISKNIREMLAFRQMLHG